jgi:ubiquinol-cytochrome c reductase cytochrome c1 subunit
MMMNFTRIFTAALAAFGLSAAASAFEGDQHEPHDHHWHHDGPFGTFDTHAVQRGFQVYQEVCASCHAMDLLKFRNLGEAGGPFASDEFPNANDNAIVMQIAASYTRNWSPDEINADGDPVVRAGLPSDAFPAPFENEILARNSNGGAVPPDLSLIVKARGHGEDYILSLLLGYDDHDVPPGQYSNPYFPGGSLAMAPPLIFEGQVEYADGTPATVDQMAEDVVVFLAWVSDPHMEARKQLGVMVLFFLFIFALLTYLAYRQVWANVKH